PEEDKDYRPPKIVPLPPARDYPDLNLSAADIDARADIFAKTGKRQFVGGAGLEGEANQKREQVIEHRALQKNQYAQNVLKSIPKGHQEAVLGLLDPVMPGIAANVRAIVERRAPIPRGYAANSYYWNTIQETARRIAPKLTDNDYIQATRTRAAFQTGTAYPAQTRAATNRALQHAAYMVVLAQGLNNQNMLMYNQAKNWMTTQFGGAGPTTFKAVLAHVAQELTKAFRGNSGALADVERELHNINENSSPTQIAGYLGAVGNLLYGQMDSLADLWNEGTNEHKHPLDMLSKAGQDAYLYLRKVDPGNYHPIMQSDGREGVSLSVDPADAARYARPHSWKLSDGTVITDYGSRYTNPPETVPIPIWPNYQPEAPNINIQQQEQ
ncbi:MAG TPA: hypothetical protein VHT52_02280, partial [Stellaceae bacterium]|nr:hypothetical protein [Stellaceae bacterium]